MKEAKLNEEPKALAPALSQEQIDAIREEFEAQWNRSVTLRNALSKLPAELVLKSGLSGRRNALNERWDYLETPDLEGNLPSPEAVHKLLEWVHHAEVLISCIISIGKSESKPKHDGRTFSAPGINEEDYPEVIDSLEEADAVSDKWSYPWEPKAISKRSEKRKWSRGDIMKYGTVAAVGGLAAFALIFDQE